jgi:hypothetical protein
MLFYLLSFIPYSVASFVNQSFNPLNWGEVSIFMFIISEIVIAVLSIIIIGIKTKIIEL